MLDDNLFRSRPECKTPNNQLIQLDGIVQYINVKTSFSWLKCLTLL